MNLIDVSKHKALLESTTETEAVIEALNSINKGEIPSIDWLNEEAKEVLYEVIDIERIRLQDLAKKAHNKELKQSTEHLLQRVATLEALMDCLGFEYEEV